MKKTYAFTIISIIIVSIGTVLLMSRSPSQSITDEYVHDNSTLIKAQPNTKVAKNTVLNNDTFSQEEKLEDVPQVSKAIQQTDIEKFLASRAFDSRDNFDKAFISDTNIVSSSALRTVFGTQDFTRVIEKVRTLDNDHTKIQNEDMIYRGLFIATDDPSTLTMSRD